MSDRGTAGGWPFGSEHGFVKLDSRQVQPKCLTLAISLLVAHLGDSRGNGSLAAKLRIFRLMEHETEASMPHFERIRDVISGPFSSEIIGQRTAAGWQLVSIE